MNFRAETLYSLIDHCCCFWGTFRVSLQGGIVLNRRHIHTCSVCQISSFIAVTRQYCVWDIPSCSLLDRYGYLKGSTFLRNVSNDLHDIKVQRTITLIASDLVMYNWKGDASFEITCSWKEMSLQAFLPDSFTVYCFLAIFLQTQI
jgi:hypothetical protein